MRAAAIFGPGSSPKDLEPFQKNLEATWLADLPTNDRPPSSSQADAILIFGGDGTVHRYLAQLVKLRIPVLVVPCGSGNDFARALNLRSVHDSLAAWRKFCSGGGNVRTVDLGVVTPLITDRQNPSESSVPHYFCCVGGVGLDGEIARRANQLPRWLRARGGYILSFPPALLGFEPIAMKISTPCAEPPDAFVARGLQPIMVAAFANAPAYGGGMKIAPQAKLDDGALDVCVIHQMSKLKLCCLFPTVYFGRHLGVTQVEYFQTERLRLETDEPLDVYADGEYLCRTPIEVSVAREALRVIRP
jgi:diacylglycerol kinase (ATP)